MICKRNNFAYISDMFIYGSRLSSKLIYESDLEVYMLNVSSLISLNFYTFYILIPAAHAHNNRNNTNSTDNFVAHRYFVRRLSICAFHRDDEYIDIVSKRGLKILELSSLRAAVNYAYC
uniref:Uncharacterized protein n=1 Tax=Glossina austeni TaxID=7395 RepID=A0A1A9UHH8_GLOAU